MVSAILKGIILGIGISAPIGPINTEIVRRGLHGGFWPAWMVGAGAGIAHAVFLAATYVGMGSLVEVWAVRLALFSLGFCLLAWVAVSSFRDAWRGAGDPGLVRPVSDGWRAAFAAGFGFAFLNPLAVLLWVSLVGASLASPAYANDIGLKNALVVGIWLGCALWDTALATLVHFSRHLVNERAMRLITFVCGLIIAYYAVQFGWSALEMISAIL
jgi:threonine/homoserine/homoserine lactone efflux protein